MPIPPYIVELRASYGTGRLLLPGVSAVLVREDLEPGRQHILLTKRTDNGLWSLPAGIMEPGEQPAAALIRELRRGRAVAVVERESEVRTKAGARRAVLSEGKLVLFGGDTCLIDTYVDITDRKRAETELSQAIRAIMSDPSWFVRVVQEKLFEIRSGNPDQPGLELLSARERDVLEQLASGKGNDAIAAELGLSAQTVRNYISTVYDKIGVRSRAEAVVWVRERGLIFPA